MKYFLRLSLTLIVSNISAAQDLQQEAFNVLARSVRLKDNAVLNQNTFGPAIQDLTTFLQNRYPKLKSKSIASQPIVTPKPAQQCKMPTVRIQKAKVENQMSHEIQEIFNDPTKYRTFTRQQLNKDYECIIQGYYCKAKLIPLVCAVGAYLHFYNELNQEDEEIDQNIKNFTYLLSDILQSPELTKDHLNTLYEVQGNIEGQNIIIRGTLAGVMFRYFKPFYIKELITKGGDPMIKGYYQGPSFKKENTIVTEENPVGLLALYNPNNFEVITEIKKQYSSFPVETRTENQANGLVKYIMKITN